MTTSTAPQDTANKKPKPKKPIRAPFSLLKAGEAVSVKKLVFTLNKTGLVALPYQSNVREIDLKNKDELNLLQKIEGL